MIRRIPAIVLVAILSVAPVATCVLAVRADAAMSMNCDAPRADETPAFCTVQMVAASGFTGMAIAPATAMPASGSALRGTPLTFARVTIPAHDTGPPGRRPPAWLRHSALLI